MTHKPTPELGPIPAKRYFTIGETGQLCDVKPHVLRYWEQEFTQLRPMKRRGNRRYYQHHEVLMIRKIRSLLYDEGFTISGARLKLQERSADAAKYAYPDAYSTNGDSASEAVADVSNFDHVEASTQGDIGDIYPEDYRVVNAIHATPSTDASGGMTPFVANELNACLKELRALSQLLETVNPK